MAESRPPRALLKGVTVSFGLVMARVDLVSVQQSNASRSPANVTTANLCPTCKAEEPLKQQLWCDHGHGPFTRDEARVGLRVGTALQATTREAVEQAKAPTVPERTADLHVYPAEQVEAVTMPSGNLFRLRSEPTLAYGLLAHLVHNPEHAFVCEMVVKGRTALYRAINHGGTIVLAELVRPERMHPFESVTVEGLNERIIEQGERLVAAMLEEFEPGDWADERAVRLSGLADAPPEPEPTRPDVKAASDNLAALLKASLAA